MPKINLTLHVEYKGVEIAALEGSVGNDIDVSQLNEYAIAERIDRGAWPAGLRKALNSTLGTEAYVSGDLVARPHNLVTQAQFICETCEDPDGALKVWKSYTHQMFLQEMEKKHPDARGFPNVDSSEHLQFSAKVLMSTMQPDHIHDVLYADDYYLSYWDWKQLLLYRLTPSKTGVK